MALVVIAILIAGYWIYGQASTYTNKRDFQQANASINNAEKQISTDIGKPDKSEHQNNCSRSYQELTGYGEITCYIDFSFAYAMDNENQSNLAMSKIQVILKGSKVFARPQKSLASSLTDAVALSSEYHEAQDIYKYRDLTCTAKYVYDTPQDTFIKLKTDKKVFYTVIGCTGPAKKLYYPLNQ